MTISRRTLLKLASFAPAAKLVGIQMAHAEDRDFRHALTLFEDIKYPAGFKHFDYVNPAAPAESLGTLLASADATKGQAVFKACAACHDPSKGGPNKVGPNLWGIVDRMHGVHEGFAYSEAMAALKDKPWSYEALNEFLIKPSAAVPGTKMAYGGLKKDADRANLLAYLATLSDSPVPFPAP